MVRNVNHHKRPSTVRRLLAASLVMVVLGLVAAGPGLAQEPVNRSWGLGWDEGLTLRYWFGGKWEFSLAGGPDDYLVKDEVRSWNLTDPEQLQGQLEIPRDLRDEHGWVRVQTGRLIAHHQQLALVGYTGLVYEWIDHQERSLELDNLLGDYDTFELDRFTHHWILTLGLRPSWQPTDFMTIESSFGLNFTWTSWDQDTRQTWAGIEGENRSITSGHGRTFQDFGWDGLASLQFLFWF